MKLLVLSDGEYGLRAALEEQFRGHKQAVAWFESGWKLTPEFTESEEPTLIVDFLSGSSRSDLPQELSAQLIALCNERDWIWMVLSDSRVFPASNKRRFVESDALAPNTSIGQQSLAREKIISDAVSRHLILRVGPIIASRGDNLLTRLLSRMREGGVVTLPEAQRFCPTPVADVVRVIAAIHDQLDCCAICWGAYHYESADPTSGYEFAEVVLAAATQYWHIEEGPVQLRSAPADSAADAYPLLNCQRLRDTFGIQQLPWRKAIPSLLKQIYAHNFSEQG